MRKRLFIAAAATLLIGASTGCAIKCRVNCTAVLVQLPCGPEKVKNGDFAGGKFMPNSSGVMPLPDSATDLSDWQIVNKNGPSSLLWVGAQNGLGLVSQDGSNFINLFGSLPGPIPQLVQPLRVEPGRYLLQFAVGWDGVRNPKGIVTVNVSLGGQGTPPATTHGTSPNHWELFTDTFTIRPPGGTVTLQFQAAKDQVLGGPFPFIGLDSVTLKELLPFDSQACLPGTGVPIK